MKEQILRGLLLRLWKQDSELDSCGEPDNNPRAASATSGFSRSIKSPLSFDSQLDHRDDLIKVGAVTPFDDLESHPTAEVKRRGRKTLMDHKIAEGMKVKLPRSFRRGAKETMSSDEAQNKNRCETDTGDNHEKGNERDPYPRISSSKKPRGTDASSDGYSGDEQHEDKQYKNKSSPHGKSDTNGAPSVQKLIWCVLSAANVCLGHEIIWQIAAKAIRMVLTTY